MPKTSKNKQNKASTSVDNKTVSNDTVRKPDSDPPYWIAIGASAGGLEALKELLGTLTPDFKGIIIIAQHLDPKHPTILRDLLARITHLPIVLVDQNITPEPGNIYIIAPGHNALIENSTIILKPAAAIGPKPSVNLLLTSLAEDVGERSVAVILSGTGTDGSQGIMAIKSANGIVLAQDEHTAKYSGMPRAAKDTGLVDLIRSPSEIALEIQQYISSAGRTLNNVSYPLIKSSLANIFQQLFDQTGYDFSGYKIKTIQRRISRRMAVNRLVNLEDYVQLLKGSTAEVESLFKDLLISVTWFFRDPEAFNDLNKVIEALVKNQKQDENLRIWVPGCANGEEPYSIAILFMEACLKFNKNRNFQIFATDIDEFALSLARKAVYTTVQLKDIKPEILERYFTINDDLCTVNKSIREKVVFARQNVIMDAPFSKIDLISCRNLLIYFSSDLQKQVFQTFHFALKSGRYLFLGKSESASNAVPELFETSVSKSQIFVRKKTSLSPRLDHVNSAITISNTRSKNYEPQFLQEKSQVLQDLDNVLIEQLIPTAIVLDESGQILHLRGDASSFLSFPQGRIDTNILSLVREELKIDVRALMQKVKRDGGKASTQALFYSNHVAKSALFLSMQKLNTAQKSQELYVLTFTEVDLSEAFISGTNDLLNEDNLGANDNLRKEIAIFKERLQTSIEELETTNEELQSTNEAFHSLENKPLRVIHTVCESCANHPWKVRP